MIAKINEEPIHAKGKFNLYIAVTAFVPKGKGGHCVLQSGFLQVKIWQSEKKEVSST
ncbi:MAG: hypothetical protein JRI93_13290 [Deltaproteobacteria bacterium]|nr:hypothetical protein [Deltaproteobacteria bacterium]MBW2613110.1 hypothetical protein [Deltaproteobacteria bacterium]MBW2635432.1 hypothetical protein [Deltaproteobacteria bacterium]